MNFKELKQQELSAFGEAAVTLDSDFMELERLSVALEKLDLETDNGMEQARKLLGRFGECGERIGTGMRAMATALEEARVRAEKAAGSVAERAAQVQTRQQQTDEMLTRFQTLGDKVRMVTTEVAELRKPAGETLTESDRDRLKALLPSLDSRLESLIGEAGEIKEAAEAVHLRGLVRNADSLSQTLSSARQKLSGFIA